MEKLLISAFSSPLNWIVRDDLSQLFKGWIAPIHLINQYQVDKGK